MSKHVLRFAAAEFNGQAIVELVLDNDLLFCFQFRPALSADVLILECLDALALATEHAAGLVLSENDGITVNQDFHGFVDADFHGSPQVFGQDYSP
jgi:hypothetical protein